MNHAAAELYNWLPCKLFWQEEDVLCHWLNMGDVKFEEPFFEHTVSRIRALPANVQPFKTVGSVDLLPEWSQGISSVAPTAFIFHLSRCGSTLVTQTLSLDPDNIVLSEAPFLDDLLRLPYKNPGTHIPVTDEWLHAAIKFYGQKRTGTEKRLFIKTDCWHIFFYESLRKLFPGIPFILLYRTPEEVLQSQQKRRGMQAVPDMVEPELMGIKKDSIDYSNFDGYFSQVMERILEQFNRVMEEDPLTLSVNYNEGISTIVQKISTACGYPVAASLLEKIEERSRYHAKYPEDVFVKEKKPESIPAYLQKAMEWYQLLEEKRLLRVSADV